MEYKFSNKIASLKPSAIREMFKTLADPSIISFAAGNPSPESFPVAQLEKISSDIFETIPVAALQYSVTEGYTPLREAVCDRLKNKFSIGYANDSTIITSGGQQGIELACKVLCNEGDAVICEDPSFIGALNAFRSNGAKTVGVPIDGDGINIDKLEQTIRSTPNAKMIYLIPTFQNPSGITMSYEKRRAVYQLALKYGLIIFEDNPYGELRFSGEDIPTLKSFDTERIVIYCSSFSKILSAGMRVGYVCAPEEIMSKMVVAKQSEDVHTNIFFQMLCHRYITEYDLDAHIESIRTLYRKKCTLMLDCIDRYIPSDNITFTHPKGGLFIWGTLLNTSDSTELIKAAIEKKVAIVPGSTFNCDTTLPSNSFRLNYSTPSDEQITEGIKRLGEAVSQLY